MKKLFNKLVVLFVFLTGGYHTVGHLWSVTGCANFEPDGSGVARFEIHLNPSGTSQSVTVSNLTHNNDAAPVTIIPVPAHTPPAVIDKPPIRGSDSLTFEQGAWKASISNTIPVSSQQMSPPESWRDRLLRVAGMRK